VDVVTETVRCTLVAGREIGTPKSGANARDYADAMATDATVIDACSVPAE